MPNLPYKAGGYEGRLPPALQAAYEAHAASAQPLDVFPQVALTKAILEQILNEHAASLQKLCEHQARCEVWYAAYEEWAAAQPDADVPPPSRPPSAVVLDVDLSKVVKAIKNLTDIMQNERKLQESRSVPIEKWLPLLTEMGEIVERHLDPGDPETERRLSDIRREWTRAAMDRGVRVTSDEVELD